MSLTINAVPFGIGFEILVSKTKNNNSIHLKNGG